MTKRDATVPDSDILNVWIPNCDDPASTPPPYSPDPPLPSCIPIFITAQPAAPSGTVSEFDEITLSVAINDDATTPILYQWYQSDGDGSNLTLLVGETSSSLVFTITAADSGSLFHVEVSNPCGGDSSAPARIFVDEFFPEECFPYACDAIKAQHEAWADSSWYGSDIVYGGGTYYIYRIPSDQGGTALESSNNTWEPSPIIPNACYNSLRLNASGGGGVTGVKDPTAGEDTGGSMLALITDVAAGGFNPLIGAVWYYDIYLNDVYRLSTFTRAAIQIASNQLRSVAAIGATESANTDSLPAGANLLVDPILAFAALSSSADGTTMTVNVSGSINFRDGGSSDVTSQIVKSVGPPGAELRFVRADLLFASSESGGGPRGYYNNFKKGTDLDLISFYRNFDDYVPPEYCPLPPT